MTLESIEQEHHFAYPALYKQLHQNGMLSWGKLGPDWYKQTFPLLKENPPFLLYASDFEIIDQPDISGEISEGPLFADKKHQFVPIGYTGAGDWYAFYYNLKNGDDIPVVLVYHDADKAVILAKNLQDFIFATLLEAIACIDPDYPGLIEAGDLKTNARNFLRTHAPYMTQQQQEIVSGVYEKGTLSREELNSILQAEIGFDLLNTTFRYQEV